MCWIGLVSSVFFFLLRFICFAPVFAQGNWYIVMNAAVEVAGTGGGVVASLYFFTIRIVVGMLLLPIFFGFVIEAFNNNLPSVLAEQAKRRDEMHREINQLERTVSIASLLAVPLPHERQVSFGEDTPLIDTASIGSSPRQRHQVHSVVVDDMGGGTSRSPSRHSRHSGVSDVSNYVIRCKPTAGDITVAMYGPKHGGSAVESLESRQRSEIERLTHELQQAREAFAAANTRADMLQHELSDVLDKP